MRKMTCDNCSVRRNSIFRDLSAEELERFSTCGLSALYRRRQVVFHEDSPAAGLYIVCSGAVKLYQSDRFGHAHIVHVAGPGEVIGELPMEADETYSVSAEIVADGQLRFLPRDSLKSFLQRYPAVGIRLIESLSRAVGEARRKVRALALKGAEGRMAQLLLQLVETTGADGENGTRRMTLRYTRRDLADMIGVAPETAIRLLSRLKRRKIISTHQRELVIHDPQKLASLANHDNIAAA